MDKVRGNINGFSFATSLCLCRGVPMVQLAAIWSYSCTSKFFRLDGLLLFCIIMGLCSVSSTMIIIRKWQAFLAEKINSYKNN